MNKGDLISQISADADISKSQATDALASVLTSVENTLKKGDKVTLIGFGTFSINERPARLGRNPQTGAEIKIKAKKVVKFKAGKSLSDSVN